MAKTISKSEKLDMIEHKNAFLFYVVTGIKQMEDINRLDSWLKEGKLKVSR